LKCQLINKIRLKPFSDGKLLLKIQPFLGKIVPWKHLVPHDS